MRALVPDPAVAVGLGGVAGVAGGVLFFSGMRRLARRAGAAEWSRVRVVGVLALGLAGVLGLLGGAASAGGPPAAAAFLAGLVLARLVVRRNPAR
ncbi:MAG TPA: hypothetical protein VKA55_10415 [Gammaproteobacteria bacterium]|nr:hypothetical protein [Gammaproteobacteria bacterium]